MVKTLHTNAYTAVLGVCIQNVELTQVASEP